MSLEQYVIPSRGQSPFTDLQLRQHSSKRFPQRPLSNICAVSIHHAAATSSLPGIAAYHSSPGSHICNGGCPGICYHFAIDYDGSICQLNDLTSVVYSSGVKKNYRIPSQADCFDKKGKYFNRYSISVLVRGSFDAPGFKGGQEPTPEQMAALNVFVHWATQEAKFADGNPIALHNVLGHCHVNKNGCPGFIIQEWIENEVWTGRFLSLFEELLEEESEPEVSDEAALEVSLSEFLSRIGIPPLFAPLIKKTRS